MNSRLKPPRKVFLRHPTSLILWPIFNAVRPYTCVMYDALLQMKNIINKLDREKVGGNIIEAGCWRGGCAGFMAHFCRTNNRTVFALDSFENGYNGPLENGKIKSLELASEKQAYDIMNKLHVNMKIISGYVKDTLPGVKQEVGKIAILRLDMNVYEPTKETLEMLYDSIVPGGYIVLDNYEMAGERRAVDDFRKERRITAPIQKNGYLEKEFWIK